METGIKEQTTINAMFPINSLGYGVAAKNILYELQKHIDVTLFPIGPIEEPNPKKAQLIQQLINKQDKVKKAKVGLKIWHESQLAERPPCEKFYGFPIFETDKLSDRAIKQILTCDHIFVCSKWAKQVLIDCLVPVLAEESVEYKLSEQEAEQDLELFISVVPLGVDTNIFYPRFTEKNKVCRFFNCGKWEVRKGHDVILKAFRMAFPHESDVELYMMCENNFPQAKKFSNFMVENYTSDYRVKILPRVQTEEEVAHIMSQMDCGLFPARAEGWNLELLEMMAVGKHVIASNCTGHTEFCDKNNAMLIEMPKKEPAYDGIWFDGKFNWHAINDEQLYSIVDYMKSFYNKWKGSDTSLVNTAGVETAEKFTWKNTANNILKEIK